VLPNLSTTAFRSTRRAVIVAAIAPVFAAGIVMLCRIVLHGRGAEAIVVNVLAAAWCGFAGVLYLLILHRTTGAERSGTRVAAIFFAIGLWIASSFALIVLTVMAKTAVAALFR
jgi:hypothetical protein